MLELNNKYKHYNKHSEFLVKTEVKTRPLRPTTYSVINTTRKT